MGWRLLTRKAVKGPICFIIQANSKNLYRTLQKIVVLVIENRIIISHSYCRKLHGHLDKPSCTRSFNTYLDEISVTQMTHASQSAIFRTLQR